MLRKKYPSDLTDTQWELIKELIENECPYQGGPKVTLDEYREILNAIYYINKTGVQWAYLPHDFPPYTTVNYHYIKFVKNGLFEKINDYLREIARETSALKKNAAPSVGIIDSQSVKSMPETKGLEVGIDGGKLVKGRKRSIVVDTMGYVICVFVHAANIYDGKAGKILLDKVFKKYNLKKVFADNTYRGEFVKYLNEKYHCEVEIKLPEKKEFKVIKIRWIVERTFAWLTRNRRLAREYERNTPSSEAMVYIASSRLILKHLSP